MAKRQRVLVVGAGKRVEETAMPALMCLEGSVEIAGVWARRSRKLKLYGGEFTVQTETGPEAYDLSQIDTIVVAVTRSQVPAVLRSLLKFDTAHIAVMLDTPVMDVGHLGATRMFKRFARVVCSEDSIALPPVATARHLIEQGTIGRLRSVHLFHSGWRNHALASIRSLAGMRSPSRITVRQWNQKWSETHFRFPGGIRASVVQPHIHGNGRLLVAGEKGVIVDYATDRSEATEIGYLVEDGIYRGVTVNGERMESELDRLFGENLPREELPNPTLDNMFKIRGFMELVNAVHDKTSPFAYEPLDAIRDHQSMRLAERLPAFVDVHVGKRSLFGAGLGAAARLTRG
jgi:predicted dehydrogenase